MESKITDDKKTSSPIESLHSRDSSSSKITDDKKTSSPIERLHSRDSSSSSSIQSSEFEDPSQGENTSNTFVRNKSGNPGEWSINSSESLFSIKMGTTSFTDLDQINEQHNDRTSSVKPVKLPSEPTITGKPTETVDSKKNGPIVNKNQESKKEVVDRKSNTKSARSSDASGQSFAFPLLVKDHDGGNPQGRPQTPKRISSININQVHVENRQATQSSSSTSSWFTRCFSFCSCRQS